MAIDFYVTMSIMVVSYKTQDLLTLRGNLESHRFWWIPCCPSYFMCFSLIWFCVFFPMLHCPSLIRFSNDYLSTFWFSSVSMSAPSSIPLSVHICGVWHCYHNAKITVDLLIPVRPLQNIVSHSLLFTFLWPICFGHFIICRFSVSGYLFDIFKPFLYEYYMHLNGLVLTNFRKRDVIFLA